MTWCRIVIRNFATDLRGSLIAEAIEMERLRGVLGPEAAPRPPTFSHLSPEYAQSQLVPIVESVDPVTLPTGEKLDAHLKYYWFGVVSVEFTAGFECDFNALPPQSYRWMHAPEVEEAAEVLLRSRSNHFRQALINHRQNGWVRIISLSNTNG